MSEKLIKKELGNIVDFSKARKERLIEKASEELRANINEDFVKGEFFMLDFIIKSLELNEPDSRVFMLSDFIRALKDYKKQLTEGIDDSNL